MDLNFIKDTNMKTLARRSLDGYNDIDVSRHDLYMRRFVDVPEYSLEIHKSFVNFGSRFIYTPRDSEILVGDLNRDKNLLCMVTRNGGYSMTCRHSISDKGIDWRQTSPISQYGHFPSCGHSSYGREFSADGFLYVRRVDNDEIEVMRARF